MENLTLKYLWKLKKFQPNPKQQEAILHQDGPLFLTAGPGSGKTRVLLWRTLNLLVFHDAKPEEIFLSTFTEKAALQLRDGLRSLLGLVTNLTGKPYDISGMYIGTVHSLCRQLITDRRFNDENIRRIAPHVLDELSQYFKIYNRRNWVELIQAGGFDDEETSQRTINDYLIGKNVYSRHVAATNIIRIFNRFSEENLDVENISIVQDETLSAIIQMYEFYKSSLNENERFPSVDFALLQQMAFNTISKNSNSQPFKHIIIDEYQDTNTIQELIFFKLAKNSSNICVVGDDDQALYRFRGATVENLVEFEKRCIKFLNKNPKRIDLNINYRSKKQIVNFYVDFIERTNWEKDGLDESYRIADKQIKAFSKDDLPSVVKTEKQSAEKCYEEIAQFIFDLKQNGTIQDYNQVAFLFPSLKSRNGINTRVEGFRRAFEALEIPIYAPRAGRFLEVEEAEMIYGVFFHIFGRPSHAGKASHGLQEFRTWTIRCMNRAEELMDEDPQLKNYIEERQKEIDQLMKDYIILNDTIARNGWNFKQDLDDNIIRILASASNLSPKTKKNITHHFFIQYVKQRKDEGKPLPIKYLINRATSLDRSILDIFYQIHAFKYFRNIFELAEQGIDEGPICNLGLLSQYLARFMDEYSPIINAQFLEDNRFINTFFNSYTYAIFRLGESEFEDKVDPFPKGRVPFLTIHQSKGLEFNVVVLANLFRTERETSINEVIIRELIEKGGEPLDLISHFDNMRMFYVGLSRAKDLLVLPHYSGRGQRISEPLKEMLNENSIPLLDKINITQIPKAKIDDEDLGKSYSYTADYMAYQRCPRQYMVFRKYGFETSRSQNMFFGNIVHQTIEDLHLLLIREREKQN